VATVDIPSALVLDRKKGNFENRQGENVRYAHAYLQDQETFDMFVVSVQDAHLLAPFEPGTVVGPVSFEVVEPTSIRAMKVRPVGGPAGGAERF